MKLTLTRHADHDPSLICRPALGYGLCEVLETADDGSPTVQDSPVTPDPVTAAVAALIEHEATCDWCQEYLGVPGAAKCTEWEALFAARRRALTGRAAKDACDG